MIQLVYTLCYVLIAYFLIRRMFLENIWFNSQGEYVVVTGCDSGFGFRLAIKLATQGVNVFAGVLTEEGRTRLENEMNEVRKDHCRPGKLMIYQLDITEDDSVERMKTFVQLELDRTGSRLWGLVNNAGVLTVYGPDDWCTSTEYQHSINVNTLGAIRVTHAFLPLVKQAKGRVVTMGSTMGRIHGIYLGPYCAAKSAVQAYMDCLRLEMRQFGVSVHLIEPGAFKTELLNDAPQRERVNRAWKALPEETRIEYGEQYKSDLLTSWRMGVDLVANSNIDWVVDSYIHALFGYWPRLRYAVGWDAIFMFIPLSLAPTSLQDWILSVCYFFQPGPRLIPQCVREKTTEDSNKIISNSFLKLILTPITFILYVLIQLYPKFLNVRKTV